MWGALASGLAGAGAVLGQASQAACVGSQPSPATVVLAVGLLLALSALLGLCCCCAGCALGSCLALGVTGHPLAGRAARVAVASASLALRAPLPRGGLQRLAAYRED